MRCRHPRRGARGELDAERLSCPGPVDGRPGVRRHGRRALARRPGLLAPYRASTERVYSPPAPPNQGGGRVPVGLAVFKTVARPASWSRVGSTPMHLRHPDLNSQSIQMFHSWPVEAREVDRVTGAVFSALQPFCSRTPLFRRRTDGSGGSLRDARTCRWRPGQSRLLGATMGSALKSQPGSGCSG